MARPHPPQTHRAAAKGEQEAVPARGRGQRCRRARRPGGQDAAGRGEARRPRLACRPLGAAAITLHGDRGAPSRPRAHSAPGNVCRTREA